MWSNLLHEFLAVLAIGHQTETIDAVERATRVTDSHIPELQSTCISQKGCSFIILLPILASCIYICFPYE